MPIPEHPAPAFQLTLDSYVSRAAPWVVPGVSAQALQLGNGCNLINWQDLGSEYQGIGWVRNFRLIPITSRWTTFWGEDHEYEQRVMGLEQESLDNPNIDWEIKYAELTARRIT